MSHPTKDQILQLARRIEQVLQIALDDAEMLRGAVAEVQDRVVVLEQQLTSLLREREDQ